MFYTNSNFCIELFLEFRMKKRQREVTECLQHMGFSFFIHTYMAEVREDSGAKEHSAPKREQENLPICLDN